MKPALLFLASAAALALSGCAAWRIGQSAELARQSEPWQQAPAGASKRLLIVGDSTAVGTGASQAANSLAGLIGREHPDWLVENRARDGAKFGDVVEQLGGSERFDIVLVQAGGNDVIRLRDLAALRADIDLVSQLALERSKFVLLMPAGNVGNAPFFFAPVSWWMTQRSRALHELVKESAARTGTTYVNLFHERSDDPFVKRRELNASDGLHPSDAGYEVWWLALRPYLDGGGPQNSGIR